MSEGETAGQTLAESPAPWRRAAAAWGTLAILAAACLVLAPTVGPVKIDLARALSPAAADSVDARIFWTARMPRVVFAMLAGAALALSGATYQALLRNALADPYTLGVSGGAAFGALVALRLAPATAGAWLVPAAALAGAAVSVSVIMALGRPRGAAGGGGAGSIGGAKGPAVLLLAGIAVNAVAGAGVMVIQYLSQPYQTFAMIRWMMGGVDVGGFAPSAVLGAAVTVAGGYIVFRAPALNLLALGDHTASHLGVEVRREKFRALAAASVLAAVTVAYAGPIGFVGLLVPHGLRLALGPDHRVLLPAAALAGATFLCAADTAARTAFAPAEVPVGIVMALLGGPCFLALLARLR